MDLQKKLSKMNKRFMFILPKKVKMKMASEAEKLAKSTILESIPQKGEKLPEFCLVNSFGEARKLEDIRKYGPVIVTFYRGSWCPYCNLELRAYQEVIDEINSLGATLVAITPELPDASLTTLEKRKLKFEVLSDVDSKYIKQIGLSFRLSKKLQEIYKKFRMDVAAHNGNDDYTLPIPATYIVDKHGTIIYSFADSDYTKRADPAEIINQLKELVD